MIQSALISVFAKDGLEPLARALAENDVEIFSTGGTADFLNDLDIKVTRVEDITKFPSVFGGRVKTLHPMVFGGILYRRDFEKDLEEKAAFGIPSIDLVIVDLYPFEETVANTDDEAQIIEKIDIGGVSLIRAAAKNFKFTSIISNKNQYSEFLDHYLGNNHNTTLAFRKSLAESAYSNTAHYDRSIADYFGGIKSQTLRYGENPHQLASFKANQEALFTQLHGKELSYNNLLDMDAAISLMADLNVLSKPACAVIKHNNACGVALRDSLHKAFQDALAGDPVSAFGGVLVCNEKVDMASAQDMNEIFFEILIAPEFAPDALALLKSKKNRIIIAIKHWELPENNVRSILNGSLYQTRDLQVDRTRHGEVKTMQSPDESACNDLDFANILVKHTRSNAIILASNLQLIGSGTGQTSRVDALKQAIQKAHNFGFKTAGAVMASDAFFPFPDCVEIAHDAGIKNVVQPGGSIKDQLSIDYCNENGMSMVFTGHRHFKH